MAKSIDHVPTPPGEPSHAAGVSAGPAADPAAVAVDSAPGNFHAMVDAAPVMIWAAGADRSRAFFNRQWLAFTGRSIDEERDDGWAEGIHPDDLSRCLEQWIVAFSERLPFEAEYRLRRRDGVFRTMIDRGAPRFDETGRFVGYVGSCIDVTDQRQSAAATGRQAHAAVEASRAKSEFLANMSHEIRTPMTAILGYTELLIEEEASALNRAANGSPAGPRPAPSSPEASSRRIELLGTIHRNGEHLLEIVNQILDLSKIEAGQMQVERLSVSPVQVVTDVVTLMSGPASDKGVALGAQFGGPIPQAIRTDPTRLRQILVNLVGNAVKFTEAGCVEVDIRLEEPTRPTAAGAMMVFQVRDTGIGLTQSQIDRIFQPFAQADVSVSRHFGGTGLGLRISRHLAELLGGAIEVQSTPGQGSAFTLSIATGPLVGIPRICPAPLAAAPHGQHGHRGASDANAAPARRTPVADPPPLAGTRVLLAEDGPDNQRLMTHLLRRAGATVDTAENGAAAIRKLTIDGTLDGELRFPRPYQLILMDMQMPEVDGYAATRILRARGYGGPILAVTANAMQSDRDACLAAGCDDYLSKPIRARQLVEGCLKLLTGRGAAKA